MMRIVTTTPIARMPAKTATNGPSAATPCTAGADPSGGPAGGIEGPGETSAADAELGADTIGDGGGTVGAALTAARFSPHSTQKRAPVTTGAPHWGQNFTAPSGLFQFVRRKVFWRA
jgi:hypothetical protein